MPETGRRRAEPGMKGSSKNLGGWGGEEEAEVEVMITIDKIIPYIYICIGFKVLLQDSFSVAPHYSSVTYEI